MPLYKTTTSGDITTVVRDLTLDQDETADLGSSDAGDGEHVLTIETDFGFDYKERLHFDSHTIGAWWSEDNGATWAEKNSLTINCDNLLVSTNDFGPRRVQTVQYEGTRPSASQVANGEMMFDNTGGIFKPIWRTTAGWITAWSVDPDIGLNPALTHGYGPTTSRPADGVQYGYIYYDTDKNAPYFWNGTTWKDASPPSRTTIPGGYRSGGFYLIRPSAATGTAVTSDNIIIWSPFVPEFDVTINSLGVVVTTGAASSAFKAGLWANNNSTMRPTGLPLASQNTGVDTSATGVKTASISSTALTAGTVYWIGTKWTGTGTVAVAPQANTDMRTCIMLGTGFGTTGTSQVQGYSASDTYGNDIAAFNATGASFTVRSGTTVPLYQFGLA